METQRRVRDSQAAKDPFSRQVLEFEGVVRLLRRFLGGPIGEPRLALLEPHSRFDEIQLALEQAAAAREYLRASPRPSLGSLKDPRPALEKLSVEGVALAGLEILEVVEVARAALDLSGSFAKSALPRLAGLVRDLPDFRSLVGELAGKILPDGFVDSSASPALGRIRRDIERLRRELQSTLEGAMRRLSRDQALQDAVVTLRNDRFVIPVRAEERRRVPGVVHGSSSSGATVYVEPLETVPLNNELVELREREAAEVQRLLGEFSRKLRERRADLEAATEILSELDLAFAKAEFARQYDCCFPEFSAERTLVLKGACHPLLEDTLRRENRRSVPVTLELGAPKTVMVISGPNTGGKTVALKTLGLAALMAQSGLPVVADEARLPRFGRVLADIGDQQSIEAALSTFSAHMANIQSMLAIAGPGDLVLLDELASSTEPNEGAALGIAILEHFRRLGAMTFVTTHHSRLKAYAAETAEAVNAAMEFDEATLRPTYRLLLGLPGKSSALDIAARLGVEASVVERARVLLDPAHAEAATLITKLHEQREELESQLKLIEARRRELEAREAALERNFQQERRSKLRELDARFEEALRGMDAKLESAIAELRSAQERAAAEKRLGRKIVAMKQQAREDWNAQVLDTLGAPAGTELTAAASPPAVGDQVRITGLSAPGRVTAEVNAEHLEVEVGRLRMRVRKDEVQLAAAGKPPALPPQTTLASAPGPAAFPAEELNVIGESAEQARERVDKFLDQAYVAGRYRLRIIHGHGKGILRKALHEMLATHPHVEKFEPALPREGGAGATIVELKM